MAAGTSALAAVGGPVGLAIMGAQIGIGIVAKIFGGMKLRAQQAANENIALQQIVAGFDQAVSQLQAAVNSGQLDVAGAQQEINSVWQWYWQSVTPKIQPNRNGCASGSGCPGDARSYVSSNGAPPGYCSGTIGASCCLGCGPIRLSIDSISDVLAAGGGTATIAGVAGNHYGLQTRPGYTVKFSPPPAGAIVNNIESSVGNLLGLSPQGSASAGRSNTGLLVIGGAFLLLLGGLVFSRR